MTKVKIVSDFTPTIDSNVRYNVYDARSNELIKSDCMLVAIIAAGLPLSDAEVRKYYGTDESSPHLERQHRVSPVQRFVFDKCVVPCTKYYRIEVCE